MEIAILGDVKKKALIWAFFYCMRAMWEKPIRRRSWLLPEIYNKKNLKKIKKNLCGIYI